MIIRRIRTKMRVHGVWAVGLAVLIWAPAAHAGDGSWTSLVSGAWSNSSKWANLTIADGAGSTAWFTNDITGPITVTNDTARTIGNVIVGDLVGTPSVFTLKTINGSALTFDKGGNGYNAQLTQTNPSAANIIGVPLILANSLDIFNWDVTDALTISNGITGTGNLTLNANNAGPITLSIFPVNPTGSITNSGSGAVSAAGLATISGGVGANVTAITENSTNSALTINTLPLTVNSSGTTLANINASGVAKLTVSGGVNGTGDLILKNNSTIADGITVSGTVTNMGRVVNSGIGLSNTLISAIIGSNVTSVVQDSGTSILVLSGANTYIANTLISNGTLRVGAANAIPDGAGKSNVLVNGTLDVNFSETINGLTGTGTVNNSSATAVTLTVGGNDQTSTFSGIITNTGAIASLALTKSGTGTLTLTGTNGYGSNTTISAGALNIRNGSALGMTNFGTTVTAGAALQIQGGITTLAEALTLNGTGVANDGALRNMSGDNTYNGAITLATASRINSDGGTLTLNGAIGGAVGLTFGGAGNVTVTNAIGTTGASTLTKDGAGTLTLSGASTYTNVTIVSNGTLLVNGSLGVGGTVRVTTNGVLGGTGVISRAVTIAAGTGGCIGGTLSPGGTDVGTLMINSNFTLVPTNVTALQPVWSVQLNATTNDLLVVNGSFIMTNIGKVTLRIGNAGAIPNNRTYTLLTWTNANPAGDGTQFDVVCQDPNWSGGTVTVDTNAKKVVLSGLLDRIANVIATNVLNTTADLIGNLTSTGSSPTTVWAFWDNTDHTTNKTWPNSTNFVASRLGYITNSIAELTPNQTNYFTYYTSNTEGEVWAQPSLSFKTWGPLSVDNDGGATNIGFTFATLRGTLLDGNGAHASIRWGVNADMTLSTTTTPTWVTEGVFSVPVNGLVNNTTYYYQSLVSNAYDTATAATITNFTTQPIGFIYVATNGPAGGDGSTWAAAFTNLQTAIDTAAVGDTIYIAGHRFNNSAAQLSSKYVWTNKPLTILGGYAADGGTPGALTNSPTILTVASGDMSNRIFFISGVTNGTLQRVTLRGAIPAGVSSVVHGAGLYIAASSNLTIASCVVSNNIAREPSYSATCGGGIYIIGSQVLLTDCSVNNNVVGAYSTPSYGGGIHIASGSVAISNSVIMGNVTAGYGNKPETGYGGGIYFGGGGTLRMWNTLVAKNVSTEEWSVWGWNRGVDGIYVGNGSASLVNCTVVGNYEVGISYVAGTVALTNTIVWGHTGADVTNFPTVGGVLRNVSHSMFGSPATMHNVNGCLTNTPLFVNTSSRDYRLQTAFKRWSVATGTWVNEAQTSPGVNAGINQDWMATATDLDGLPRLLPDMVVDMGAYEANPQVAIVNIIATNVIQTTADLIGNLTATGASPTTVWAFWDTTDRTTNKTWTYSTNFVATRLGRITNSITGLNPNQTNYFTYYASNTEGEAWAQPSVLFKTYGPLSVDNGIGATSIGYTIATLNGTLLSGNAAFASVRWGVNADLTLSTTSTPVWVEDGPFSFLVTGLVNSTTYYYQCLVSNAFGTAAAAAITNFATTLYTGLYVATNGPAGGDGSSWGMAFTNIASAFAVAPTGETIYVAGHTFALTSQLVWPTNNLTLLGGYAATNTSVGPGNYDSLKWPTIIMRNPANNTRLLSMLNKTNALIERVTFRGGNGGAAIADTWYGAGLYATNTYGQIRDTVFENNGAPDVTGSQYGGGAYLLGGGLTFEHVVFANNRASCPASGYTAVGGGVFVDSGTHRFRNILGVGSRLPPATASTTRGSFLYVKEGTVTVENATVAHNSSGVGNAALYRGGGSLQVANSILWDNHGGDSGGTITFSNSCAIGLTAGVNGNLNQDPLLQTPLLYLAANSPCIAQGNRTIEAAGVTNRTSFTNGVLESAGTAVNLGYHFREGCVIDRELWVNPDPATGSDANSGTAGSPLRTITKALTLAPRTRINLAAGNYVNGNETFPLTIADGRTAQLIGTNRDTTVINSSGSAKTALMLVNSLGDNRIEGVTLTTGNSSRGLTISNAVFTLTGCSIASNLMGSYAGAGAGLHAIGAHGWIQDTLFQNNVGGMNVFDGSHGGGVYLAGGGMLFDRVQIISNRAAPANYSAYGGGMYIDQGMHRLKNILMASNNVTGTGGGVGRGGGCYINDGTVVIENATVVRSSASGSAVGGAIYRAGGTVSVNNSILWDNPQGDFTGTIAFSNSCSTSLTAGVQGNLTNDPLFVDTTYYHLQSKAGNYVGGYFSGGSWGKSPTNSPCIDAGDTNSPYALEPEPNGRRVNLGAYGNTPQASLSVSVGTVLILQ
jgi:autotransporter-associated beta strand protein